LFCFLIRKLRPKRFHKINSSPLIRPKLDEMGGIIRKIRDQLFRNYFESVGDALPPLIVVLGDHGMADIGGHGGATPAEVLVPVVAISPGIKSRQV
jgi:ethanolaminephosphotransferase